MGTRFFNLVELNEFLLKAINYACCRKLGFTNNLICTMRNDGYFIGDQRATNECGINVSKETVGVKM